MLRAARSLAAFTAVARATVLGGVLVAAGAAAVVPSGATSITGIVRAPSEQDRALAVHAWSAATGKRYSTSKVAGQSTYVIDVPPGRYFVFAVPADPGAPPLYAGHTQFTLCARDPAKLRAGACQDHALVEIEVGTRRVEGVDVTDWFLDGPTVTNLARALDRPGNSWTEAGLAAPRFREYPAPVLAQASAQTSAPATAPTVGSATGNTATATAPTLAPAGATPVLETAGADDPRLERDRTALTAALHAPPNFAGRFALLRVPCADGAPDGCSGAAILDLVSGRTTYPPALNPLPARDPCLDDDGLRFRSDSRLLELSGRDGESVVTRYFVWSADALTLRIVASRASEYAERCGRGP